MKASELKVSPKNWRTHPDTQRAALTDMLQEVGISNAVVARRLKNGKLQLIDGHLRADVLAGDKVPVLVLDVTEAEADALLATMDPIGALAGKDDAALAKLTASISTSSKVVLAMLEALKGADAELLKAGQTDPDDVPEKPKKPWVKAGQMFGLGAHRILCGDCTKPEDVDIVMGGDKASMCWTDPPWNVALGSNAIGFNAKRKARGIEAIANDDLGEAFPGFCSAFSGEAARVMEPGALMYLAMSSSEWSTADTALRGAGFHWSTTIIWAKDSLVLGRRDYHSQYEPIWYGWKEGAGRLVELEDRTQSDLWSIPRPKRSDEHPTMKPIELVVRSLTNSSKPKAIVFEPFSGSGTTLLACEQTGRACRAIELEPAYVQVAIERWQKFTGEKAVKL